MIVNSSLSTVARRICEPLHAPLKTQKIDDSCFHVEYHSDTQTREESKEITPMSMRPITEHQYFKIWTSGTQGTRRVIMSWAVSKPTPGHQSRHCLKYLDFLVPEQFAEGNLPCLPPIELAAAPRSRSVSRATFSSKK